MRHYVHTRIRPQVAPVIKSRNALARMCETAIERGLTVRARLDPFDNAPLAAKHPTAPCVDVFGRPHESRLCLSNPDVREFVAAIVEDVSAHLPVESIELANFDFGPPLYAQHTLQTGLVLGDAFRLLNLCFCPACRQRASESTDVEEVAQRIHARLKRQMDRAGANGPAETVNGREGDPLSAYVRMRSESCISLLRMIRRRCSRPIQLRISEGPVEDAFDFQAAAECCDGFVIPANGVNVSSHGAGSQKLAKFVGYDRMILEIEPNPPRVPEGPALVSTVHEAAEKGFAAIIFANYGLTPEPCLAWVRQAIRFARRQRGE